MKKNTIVCLYVYAPYWRIIWL